MKLEAYQWDGKFNEEIHPYTRTMSAEIHGLCQTCGVSGNEHGWFTGSKRYHEPVIHKGDWIITLPNGAKRSLTPSRLDCPGSDK